ncbi:MAG: thioredoxin family protein [Acidobacteria bacterium]|nr:thioredoxin family protein [Acidobacteriota bacterium]
MKRFLPALLIAAAALPAFAQGPTVWEHDLEAAKARAKREHKQIFMDIYTDWCGWCTKMRNETFPTPEAQVALQKFVPLSVCTQLKDGTPTANKPLEKHFGVQGFPSLYILDENGNTVRSLASYLPPKEFSQFLDGTLDTSKMN